MSEEKRNRLRLEPRVERHPYWPESVWLALFVDGWELTCREWPSVVDLQQLRESAARDGEFFIFTCECGDAGCAGIEEPVTVWRDGAGVHWRPGDARRFIGIVPDHDRDWEEQAREANGGAEAGVPSEFTFASAQYAEAIEQDIGVARTFIARLDRSMTFTPETNATLLRYPDLDPAEAMKRQSEALAAWREEHPLPPGPVRWGRLAPGG